MEVTIFSFEAVNVLYNKLECFGRENIYSKQISISSEFCYMKTLENKGFLYYTIYKKLVRRSIMARGRKNLTLDEQLTKITTEIENMETSLKEMKKAKKELEEQIHQQRLSELDELIQEKGLSFDELKEMLSK